MRRLLVLFILLFIAHLGYSQCAQILRQGRTVYDEGRIHELPSLLASCIKSGFSDEERTEAYRLLILSYIYLDEPEKADETMLALLRDNPEFQINQESDPAELINLYNSFRTKPIFSYGLRVGSNASIIEVTNTYSVLNSEQKTGEYLLNPGYLIGLVIEKEFSDKIKGSLEILYVGNLNTYENKFDQTDSLNKFIESQTIQLSQTGVLVPLAAQLSVLKNSKLNPYFLLGGSFNYVLSASFNGETNSISESFEGPTVDLISQRKQMNIGLVAGFGINLDLGKNTFNAQLRFNYGLLNQVEESKRYTNQSLLYDYGYVDNDFKLHSMSLSLAYIFPFYKPKKLID